MLSVDNFGTWLVAELEQRDLSQSDLARMSGLSRGTLSNMISGVRGRGPDSIMAIAKALKLPPEQVFRAAGILPPDKKINENIETIIHEVENLPPQDQAEILSYIRWKNNQRKK